MAALAAGDGAQGVRRVCCGEQTYCPFTLGRARAMYNVGRSGSVGRAWRRGGTGPA